MNLRNTRYIMLEALDINCKTRFQYVEGHIKRANQLATHCGNECIQYSQVQILYNLSLFSIQLKRV